MSARRRSSGSTRAAAHLASIVARGEVSDFTAAKDEIFSPGQPCARPADLYSVPLGGGAPRRLTRRQSERCSQRQLGDYEQFSFKGWNDETVYGYVVKPYGFEPGKHYPVAFVVHGGPQGSMQNIWHYRWNAQTFAGRGYGVVMIDFHGSPGYGQAFTDSISRDWGGKPLVDLQKGPGCGARSYPWLDGTRACALGASYGGFMMNWIEGNWPDRFRCIVNHDGVFDQRMMYYSTEELWFKEWENGGTQYEQPARLREVQPGRSRVDAGTRRCWSSTASRISASPTPGPRHLHGAAAPRHREQAAGVSRREPLGVEAGEQRLVVSRACSAGWMRT